MKITMEASLFGKHPSSSEYINLGQNSNFTLSIINWIKQGYEAVLKIQQINQSNKIQHLYFLDRDRDCIVCASIKLSRDANGREYPLVVLVEMHGNNQKEYFQDICNKNLEIFRGSHSLEELGNILKSYKTSDFRKKDMKDIDTNVLAAFVSGDFSKMQLFYKSVGIDNFIEMMR